MSGKKILIAEDDPDISWALTKSLQRERADLEIVCMDNGLNALEKLKQDKFDLVISDICMPGQNGLSLAKEIRRVHPDTKVIIISAFSSTELIEKIKLLGAYFYVEKPFDMGYLKKVIFSALDFRVLLCPELKEKSSAVRI